MRCNGKLEIDNKPQWLGDFVKKYKSDYDFHITFKQPCIIHEEQGTEIKKILSDLFKKHKPADHKIKIIFDRILPDESYECVMLSSKRNPKLNILQKKIIAAFKNYQNYYQPETKKYEENFQPHLTIAIDLDKKSYQKAIQNIPAKFQISGQIKEIVLDIIDK